MANKKQRTKVCEKCSAWNNHEKEICYRCKEKLK